VAEFTKPLTLKTPHEKSQRAKDAQYLMGGHSRFPNLHTYKGAVDGDYGPESAQATRDTKWQLGYPAAACDKSFGQTLYEYLRRSHWRPLPKTYQVRRAARLKAAAETVGSRALAVAETQIGTKEFPFGSNLQKYGAWYGDNGVPWCAQFESWCFDQSGYKSYRYEGVEAIVSDARADRNNLHVVAAPRPGDIVAYTLHGDPYAHTAFFHSWIDSATFLDLGGNTGPVDMSNGGEVLKQQRSRSIVTCFVRVGS